MQCPFFFSLALIGEEGATISQIQFVLILSNALVCVWKMLAAIYIPKALWICGYDGRQLIQIPVGATPFFDSSVLFYLFKFYLLI